MLERVIVLGLLFGAVAVYGGIFTKGKARINIDYVHECEGKNAMTVFHVKYDRCNKTHRCFNGNFTLPMASDKHMGVDLEAQKWGDGGWKANAFKIHLPDACKNLNRILGKNWQDMMVVSGWTKGCPMAPGVYVVQDWYINLDDFPIAFMYGKYRLTYQLVRLDKVILCKVFDISVA